MENMPQTIKQFQVHVHEKEELNNIDDRLFKLTKEHDYNEEYMLYVNDTRVYHDRETKQSIGGFAIHSNVDKIFNELKEEFNNKAPSKEQKEPDEFKILMI